jgi:hypothetical protein
MGFEFDRSYSWPVSAIIANVTGGMQDQMRFVKDGQWIDFDADFPSNHRGTIIRAWRWAFPVYPTSRSIQ